MTDGFGKTQANTNSKNEKKRNEKVQIFVGSESEIDI